MLAGAGKEQGVSLDNEHANKITLILLGVLLLLVFMDSQAKRHYDASRLGEDVPEAIEQGRAALEPVRRSAEDILEKANGLEAEHVLPRPEAPEPESLLKVDGSFSLYFFRFRGNGSEMVRVHRAFHEPTIPVSRVLEFLEKGPAPSERGLLNAFDDVRLRRAWLEGDTAVVDLSPSIGSMSEHVIRDRLDQLVLTLTAFPEIKKVKILVEGERASTLAAGKISIASPLTRPTRPVRDFSAR